MNESISYSDLRSQLKASCDRVCEERIPLLVKRRNGDDVVILSKEDYAAMEETAYLLQSPANAQRLLEALQRDGQERVPFASVEDLRDETGI
jgi:antitoxin YefM